MPERDRESWDERYRAGEFGFREPDAFVIEAHRDYLTQLLPADSAGLDLAGGTGHHAIWLAQQGWRMTLVDWSKAALEIAGERFAASRIANRLEIVNGAAGEVLTQFQSEDRRFGFILVSFFLDRNVLPLLPQVLSPGGLLLYRTYTVDNERLGNPRGPRNPEYLLRSQELLQVYREMKILHYDETVSKKGVAELIAQCPQRSAKESCE
jgi:tellurite methyltransferase